MLILILRICESTCSNTGFFHKLHFLNYNNINRILKEIWNKKLHLLQRDTTKTPNAYTVTYEKPSEAKVI